MTSHQFSANKNTAKYDFKTALKSIIAPTVITFIWSVILFILAPLQTFISYYNKAFSVKELRKAYAMCLTNTDSGELIGIWFLILGSIFALMAFKFIMRKKTVNVFLSIGIDRRTLYKNRVTASAVMIAVSIAIPVMIDAVMNIYFFAHAGYIIKYAFLLFAECFVYAFTGFSIMAIAMSLCTTIMESIFFGGAITCAPSAVVYFIDRVCADFLRGYNHSPAIGFLDFYDPNYFQQPSLISYTSIINPLFLGKAYGASYTNGDNLINFTHHRIGTDTDYYDLFYSTKGYTGYEDVSFDYIVPVIVWAVISALFIVLAKQLFIRIKAENAGVHGTKPFASKFFAVELALLAFAAVADAAHNRDGDVNSSANNVFAIAVSAVVMLICYFIILSICKRTVKHKAKELITPCVTVALVTVITVILATGGFGYSSYVPEADEIDKAIISASITDFAASEIMEEPYEDSYTENLFSLYRSEIAMGLFTDEEDLKALTQINKKLIEETDNMSGNGVYVYYEMKNGKIVSRYYEQTDFDAAYSTLSLRDSKAVREELTYLLTGNAKEKPITDKLKNSKINESLFFSYCNEEHTADTIQKGNIIAINARGISTGKTIRNTPELRKALLDDLLNQTYEQRFRPSEQAIGGLFFELVETHIETAENYDETINYEPGYYSDYLGGYYIYPSMTNTVAYLKSTGEYELFKEKDEEIVSISIEKCRNIRNTQIGDWGSDSFVTHQFIASQQLYDNFYYELDMPGYFKNSTEFTDKEQIKELMSKSKIYYFANDNDYILLIKYKNSGYATRLIPADEIPDRAVSQNT